MPLRHLTRSLAAAGTLLLAAPAFAQNADLSVALSLDGDFDTSTPPKATPNTAGFKLGSEETYTVTVTNTSTLIVTEFTLNATLDPALKSVSVTDCKPTGTGTSPPPFPCTWTGSPIAAGKEPLVLLPDSIVLDDAPGPERIFALFSDRKVEDAEVTAALAALGAAGADAIRATARLALPYDQASVVFEKGPSAAALHKRIDQPGDALRNRLGGDALVQLKAFVDKWADHELSALARERCQHRRRHDPPHAHAPRRVAGRRRVVFARHLALDPHPQHLGLRVGPRADQPVARRVCRPQRPLGVDVMPMTRPSMVLVLLTVVAAVRAEQKPAAWTTAHLRSRAPAKRLRA